MKLGQRIQQIRVGHGLSQEEFAEKLGTTRQTVSRWELDQTYPEIAKIVRMSRMFSVTIDSILKEGISTFEAEEDSYMCGVYRGSNCEIVETEKFAVIFELCENDQILRARLYRGFEEKKNLVAIVERDRTRKTTVYAYRTEENETVSNSNEMAGRLNEVYNVRRKQTLRRLESFSVDHDAKPLPTVREAGIPKCLTLWRMADGYEAGKQKMNFYLCTGRTEYIFSIIPEECNIYCGASYNIAFDLGLFGGGQFFRIRNWRDNSEPWCRFTCDFSVEAPRAVVPTDKCEIGQCVETNQGMMWCVKRYTDDEIVLQGCGGDEYTYRRDGKRTERFVNVSDDYHS